MLLARCRKVADEISKKLQESKLVGRTLVLHLKTVNFEVKAKSIKLDWYTNSFEEISEAAQQLLKQELPLELRKIGISVGSLKPMDDPEVIAQQEARKISQQ